ncbi:hypothetical protein ACMD2_26923 [Ananas comosus]|uniref:Uncharacterized protein n=1 Tax=Ananas comosus TaxID=4615 RepID=A0A199VSV0_ANACO|nr:hypothetical protein ACMD2_26923 [Ananas comosus]
MPPDRLEPLLGEVRFVRRQMAKSRDLNHCHTSGVAHWVGYERSSSPPIGLGSESGEGRGSSSPVRFERGSSLPLSEVKSYPAPRPTHDSNA